MEHITVGNGTVGSVGPDQIVNAIHALQIHGDALQTIGDLARHGETFNATGLLKISELSHLHAVQPHFPTQAPGTERR